MEDRLRTISLIGLRRLVGIIVVVAVGFLSLLVGSVSILRQRRRVQLGWRCAWAITARGWTCDRPLLWLWRLSILLLGLVKTRRRMVL